MRSITLKLILSFLGVSLVIILLIVLFTRYSTDKQFRNFSADSNRSNLLASLEQYYSAQGSWTGIENAGFFWHAPAPQDIPPTPRDPMTVVDLNRQVIRPGSNYQLGDVLSAEELKYSSPIVVNNEVVGYLIFTNVPFGENSLETTFLKSINDLLLYVAIGTSILALLLGILLSRTLTRPIRELTAATIAVSEGDLTQQVPVRSRDELGGLARAFNKMSADLQRSTKARRQMTADIAHELRTPLSLIIGHAEAVHDNILQPTRENFEIIREEASRLENLVDDLRTISLADAGELTLSMQVVPPQKIINEIVSIYQHAVQKRKISLELHMEEPLPDLVADPGRITQVFRNIVDNALRYTPEGGTIVLSGQGMPEGVQFSITDSGPGVAEQDLGRIFDRLYRADASRQHQDSGSGLGLAIAKSILELHNGRIWAEPAPQQGLRIVIFLPA
jgi:two-component system, OmpR family, sensor histidine kinase BaeS